MPTTKKKKNNSSKLNFNSPKARGLLLLIAFALVGGGVMVYRSFASTTTQSFVYDVSQGTLKSSAGSAIVTDDAKNSLQVVSVAPGGKAIVDNAAHGITVSKDQNAQYCIYGTGGGSGEIRLEAPNTIGGKHIFKINKKSTGYGDACTDRFASTETLKGPFTLHNDTGANIKIRSFTIHFVNGSVVTPIYVPEACTKNCNGK